VGVTDSGQHGFGSHGGVGQDLYGAGCGSVQQVCGVNGSRNNSSSLLWAAREG